MRDKIECLFVSPHALSALTFTPDLIHFQHEYGIYGGKTPFFYSFPSLIKSMKKKFNHAKLVATAHTVLPTNYLYPLKGRGLEIPFRFLANQFLGKKLNTLWSEQTWGRLDAVIVHSEIQVQWVQSSGTKRVQAIPHFVFKQPLKSTSTQNTLKKNILVFGFFTPEKGQDIAIEAIGNLPPAFELTLVGGVRRKKDALYKNFCLSKIKKLNLSGRIYVYGYASSNEMDRFYENADLVLAPFRETTGSGSLAQALARGCAILTSDLPINVEINARVSGAIAFFKSEDPKDCAFQIESILNHSEAKNCLRTKALTYAEMHTPELIAKQHVEFYKKLLK